MIHFSYDMTSYVQTVTFMIPVHVHVISYIQSQDIMGLLDKTRALGYSRSAELMADMRNLQGKCRKAVTEWGGGDPETGGGFGAGSGRMVVRAMDTLAATMEGLLARSREEVRGSTKELGSSPDQGICLWKDDCKYVWHG